MLVFFSKKEAQTCLTYMDHLAVEKPVYNEHTRDPTAPFLKISPGLMHIDNKSLASIARTARGVGVGDLREALEGRASMSNTALASTAHSLHTDFDHHSSGFDNNLQALALARTPTGGATKNRKASRTKPAEVRDVLNKLGIGKNSGSTLLHAPLPTGVKKDESRWVSIWG
jgi:protein EFR3